MSAGLPSLELVTAVLPSGPQVGRAVEMDKTLEVASISTGANNVEDVEKDGLQGGVVSFQPSIKNVQRNTFEPFDLYGCPECKTNNNSARPVLERCGHLKCGRCYGDSDCCRQCSEEKIHGPEVEDSSQSKNSINAGNVEVQAEEEQEKIFIRSPKDLFSESETSGDDDDGTIAIPVHKDESVLWFGTGSDTHKSITVMSNSGVQKLGHLGGLLAAGLSKTITVGMDNTSSTTEGPENESPRTQDLNDTTTVNNQVPDSTASDSSEENVAPLNQRAKPAGRGRRTLQKATKKSNRLSKKVEGRRKLASDHILRLQNSNNKYKCTKCDEEFKQKYQYAFHVYCDPTNGPRPYRCKICAKEFTSRSHYQYHERQHTGEKPFECPTCNLKFIQKVKLNRHMKLHQPNPTATGDEKMFLCVYCDKLFSTLKQCRRHIENHVLNGKNLNHRPFECSSCKKRFRKRQHLNAHKKTHAEECRLHKCSECPSAFVHAKDLTRHFLRHSKLTPFHCEVCLRKFNRKDNLERHLRSAHGLEKNVVKMLTHEQGKAYKKQVKASQPLTLNQRQ